MPCVRSSDCPIVICVASFFHSFRFLIHSRRYCPRCVSRMSIYVIRDRTNNSALACFLSASRAFSPERNRRCVTLRILTDSCVVQLPLLCCPTLMPMCSMRTHEHRMRLVRLSQLVTLPNRSEIDMMTHLIDKNGKY